ncbi:MAG TPA: hypothetical protein VFN01_00520 [Marinobacter sp.]|uniref:hypothetical protein n=1 Tax=Marinobacter sp. TaxID=50741 RepID=UPI002D810A60|nr:hypothetical protein [Marinobacter sp.]HET8799641.1 hypothetical protein [Marinobacter sp.]
MSNDLEKRIEQLEAQHRSYHSVTLKLINRELALRAAVYSLLEHCPDQHSSLVRSYGKFLTTILEDVPPDLQRPDILQEIEEMLLDEISKRG